MPLMAAAEKQKLSTKRVLEALGRELGEDQATLEELYKAARDENELLEFKNYELQFKIQELESKQKNLLSAITTTKTITATSCATATGADLNQSDQVSSSLAGGCTSLLSSPPSLVYVP
jgi:peptidoglycan hydrolase CwlO-like protein